MAVLLSNIGRLYHSLGDMHGALAAFERALMIEEKHYGPDPPILA
jgi:hypothetical protein